MHQKAFSGRVPPKLAAGALAQTPQTTQNEEQKEREGKRVKCAVLNF